MTTSVVIASTPPPPTAPLLLALASDAIARIGASSIPEATLYSIADLTGSPDPAIRAAVGQFLMSLAQVLPRLCSSVPMSFHAYYVFPCELAAALAASASFVRLSGLFWLCPCKPAWVAMHQ